MKSFLIALSILIFTRPTFASSDQSPPVSPSRIAMALSYLNQNKERIPNKNIITFIDFSKHSGQRRFHVYDVISGDFESFHVAHGRGSDPEHTGFAKRFSNTPGSYMSSLGFFITAESYESSAGYALYLDGQESSNSNVRSREVVIHGASYVNESLDKMGRSLGCPALPMSVHVRIINTIRNGSLLFAYSN